MDNTDVWREKYEHIPEKIAGLAELSYNLWWSWHPEARMLFKSLDRPAWKESVHNPVKMLMDLPREILDEASKDAHYLKHYKRVMSRFKADMEAKKCWFSEKVTAAPCQPIAYFSAEYGLQHSLPFYAGGLGFLAGDHLKECSDLGVPLVAVGFMYPEGYFRQKIRVDGWQEDIEEVLVREAAPITRVLEKEGEQLVVKVPIIEPEIHVAVWRAKIGRVDLYLMDTDIEQNSPWNREISSRLYIGDKEHRLVQEIVLGIGGSEILNAMRIEHSLTHLNEGHTAFALLEKIRKLVEEGLSFDEAAKGVRSSSIFTTHTPVPAGHDVFPFYLMDKYFKDYYPLLDLSRDSFLELGSDPKDADEGFNMTVLALKMASFRNGVSKRHGEIARDMWQQLWPDRKVENVPIDSITNGVHVPTWIEPKIELLFNKYLGEEWKKDHDNPEIWSLIDDIPDQELWQVYIWLKIKLVNAIRDQARRLWVVERIDPINVVTGGAMLDPFALTIGFARRFAGYKRAYLIFQDLERLKKLVNNKWRPLQIIFAGKAHPADEDGKRIIQQIFNYARNPDLCGRIAFVENYNEQLAQYMVHGVDVWLNNPIPPLEASGTSGMKASLNGVPSLSILDGWWIEGFNGKNGWAFDGNGNDERDADAIYNILEKEVIPLYYKADEKGVPKGWVKVMKEAIKTIGPKFSSRRMVKEYTKKFYMHPLKKS
jgi:starch phosphorylase